MQKDAMIAKCFLTTLFFILFMLIGSVSQIIYIEWFDGKFYHNFFAYLSLVMFAERAAQHCIKSRTNL